MTEQDWNFPEGRFSVLCARSGASKASPLYIVLNAAPQPIEFTLPMLPEYTPLDSGARHDADVAAWRRNSHPARNCRRRRARFWRLRGPHDRRHALWCRSCIADGVTFRLWAPAAEPRRDRCSIVPHPMQRSREVGTKLTFAGARAGTLYKFRIDGEIEVPDPASHFQPRRRVGTERGHRSRGVSYGGQRDWRGRPWEDAAFLELHVGTFTPAGTFRSAIERLDHVARPVLPRSN